MTDGVYDDYYKRAGMRCAHADHTSPGGALQVGTQQSHIGPNGLPRAIRFVCWNWECNRFQYWSPNENKTPAVTSDPKYPPNTYTISKYTDALTAAIKAFNLGYASAGFGDCPYWHGTRSVAPKTGGKFFAQWLDEMQDPTVLKWVGQSQHHSKQECKPTTGNPATVPPTNNNDGIWFNTGPDEGLNNFINVCRKNKWVVILDEYGVHFGGEIANDPTKRGYLHTDYWLNSAHRWMLANPDIAGGIHFYAGDQYKDPDNTSATAICNTSLIADCDPPRAGDGGENSTRFRWAQARAEWLRIYRKIP